MKCGLRRCKAVRPSVASLFAVVFYTYVLMSTIMHISRSFVSQIVPKHRAKSSPSANTIGMPKTRAGGAGPKVSRV
jgi:hypothetical protein